MKAGYLEKMYVKEAEAFLNTASEYCHLIENFSVFSESDKVINLLKTISSLYAAALTLPESNLAEEEITALDFALPDINLGVMANYWALFDPYTDEELVACSLNDDLQDIYRDVKEGILLFQNDKRPEATWHWKFTFESHWGQHALQAMRVLHGALKAEG
ncbi:DUF5063 domain-containing protein [Metabacillus indicus]|uniref:DUF5063 domain-containing protein n=1 Tax=Metabacillus indicus TaxID=246786 RepID=UPI00249158AF|nr:DUF5063 domain-containing protein [Metabacillus indicus]